MAVSKSGILATGSRDGIVVLWSLDRPGKHVKISGSRRQVYGLNFSPEENHLLIRTSDEKEDDPNYPGLGTQAYLVRPSELLGE